MKYKILSMVLLFMLLISSSAYAMNFTPEEVYDSVVVVYTETGIGSGFAIKESLIITNAHVVGNNTSVMVGLYDGTNIKGIVVKADIDKDLALIKIDKLLIPLELNTDNVRIGQEAYAIGAPKDMPYTITKGIVSALDRQLGQNTYVQVDASVNSGNSGGPLIDDVGNVIGIITLKATDAEGMGFALKSSEMISFIENVEDMHPDDSVEFDPYSKETQDEKTANLVKLTRENEILKMTVVALLAILVPSLVMNFKKYAKRGRKDEFDFEIEIEERIE